MVQKLDPENTCVIRHLPTAHAWIGALPHFSEPAPSSLSKRAEIRSSACEALRISGSARDAQRPGFRRRPQ
jgi:hypothetical protein